MFYYTVHMYECIQFCKVFNILCVLLRPLGYFVNTNFKEPSWVVCLVQIKTFWTCHVKNRENVENQNRKSKILIFGTHMK